MDGRGPLAPEPIGLIDRDWRDEISFHPRRARPGHLDRLGAGRLTDEQASALAETLEGRKREVRGIDTVAIRAPQVVEAARKQGRLSHFPPKRKAARSPNRRASIERRRTLAASGPMPPQLAAGSRQASSRRCGSSPTPCGTEAPA